MKYDNQIVTTLNPNFEENDSIIAVGKKELAKLPLITQKKQEAQKKASETKKTVIKTATPKVSVTSSENKAKVTP